MLESPLRIPSHAVFLPLPPEKETAIPWFILSASKIMISESLDLYYNYARHDTGHLVQSGQFGKQLFILQV